MKIAVINETSAADKNKDIMEIQNLHIFIQVFWQPFF